MKEIPLTKGLFALVDDEDFEELSKYKWSATKIGNTFYALRCSNWDYETKKSTFVYMHRQILGLTDRNIFTDHEDRNGLNNQRNNIRIATRSQNLSNVRSGKGSTSKYLGVSFMKRDSVWVAQISKNRKFIWLGRHKTEEEAALAYNKAAKELHGEFANLNQV